MHIQFFSHNLFKLIVLIFASSAYINAEEPNWKTVGCYKISALHGSLTLSENMFGLFGADLTQDIKNELDLDPSVLALILMGPVGTIQIVPIDSPELDFIILKQSEIDAISSGFVEPLKQQIEAGKVTQGLLGTFKWIGEQRFNQASKTFFMPPFECITDNEKLISFSAFALGHKVITYFIWTATEDEYAQFKEQFETLVNGFKFDPEFTCNAIVFEKDQEVMLGLFVLIMSILIASIVFFFYWRRKTRTGKQKKSKQSL